MKYMVDELNKRAQLQKAIQTPNSAGGFTRSYETLKTFWLGLQLESSYISAIRGQQIGEGITQIAIARYQALQGLGAAFDNGFSKGFDTIPDIDMVKSNYFIFVQEDSSSRGRLFRIMGMSRDEKNRQWVKIQLHQIEEQGTGFQV